MPFMFTNISVPAILSPGSIGTISGTISNDFPEAKEVSMVSPFASMTIDAQSVILGSSEPLLNFGTSWAGGWASASSYPVPADMVGSFSFGFTVDSSLTNYGLGTAVLGFSLESSSEPFVLAANFEIFPP